MWVLTRPASIGVPVHICTPFEFFTHPKMAQGANYSQVTSICYLNNMKKSLNSKFISVYTFDYI